MLIECRECGKQISDKASFCPHCGYSEAPKPKTSSKPKHMKLPNGFGQISEIKNKKLRNPFRVMVTVGHDDNGKPISKLLKPKSYFKTYNEAYEALLKYNQNPYDVTNLPTMADLFDLWMTKYQTNHSASAIRGYNAAWKYCTSIANITVRDVRPKHIRFCIEQDIPVSMKSRVKLLLSLMLAYAVEYEITDRNYAKDVSSSEEPREQKHHISFTESEMKELWAHKDDPFVDMVLIQCYTGFRPQELCGIRKTNISSNIIVAGMKTKAGIDRRVPIHPAISRLIQERLQNNDSEYLFIMDNRPISYETYKRKFLNIISKLKLNAEHLPHDCRKYFITEAKKHKVDEYAIKRIVGHSIRDVTEAVYTERGDDWLYEEICKIPVNF